MGLRKSKIKILFYTKVGEMTYFSRMLFQKVKWGKKKKTR